MANPFGIEQVDVPGILGVYQGAQDRRVNQMLLQRRMAAEDRALAQHDTISNIWKNYQDPGKSKGGDPSSSTPAATPLPAPVAALAAGSAPSPLSGAYATRAPMGAEPDDGGEIAAPMAARASATPASGAAPSPMGNLPPVNPASVTPEDQTFVQANEQGIRQLLGLNPEEGMQFLKFAQGLDADKRAKIVDAQDAIHTAAASLQNVPYPQRKAALLAQAPDLLAAHPGLSPALIQNFDPTDQNIQSAIGQSIGMKGMLEYAEKTATMAETHRHNVAEEANSANNGALSAGLIPPGYGGSPIEGPSASIPGDAKAKVAQLADTYGQIVPGGVPTSGLRTPAQQAALRASGATFTTNSKHLSGDAIDVPMGHGQTAQSLTEAFAQKGIPVRVIAETGNGAGQGTGPHFHIQRVGGGSPTSAPAAGLRIIPGGKLDHSADSTLLDDNGITYAAQIYAKTGQIPPLGQGKDAAKLRAQIVGRAAQLDAAGGVSGTDRAGQMADYKADRGALTSLSRTATQVLASEKTAQLNAQQVLQTAVKGAAKTGVPIFNSWVQLGRNKGNGDPDVAEFNLAVGTFATEYAKVISGATGGAVTSDSARHEVMGWINNAQTPEQLQRVIARATTEMQNRRTGLEEQQKALRDRLGSGNGPTVTATPHVSNAADYAKLASGTHYVDPQGQPRIKR